MLNLALLHLPDLVHVIGHDASQEREDHKGVDHDEEEDRDLHERHLLHNQCINVVPVVEGDKLEECEHRQEEVAKVLLDLRFVARLLPAVGIVVEDVGEEDCKHVDQEQHEEEDPEDDVEGLHEAARKHLELTARPQQAQNAQDAEHPQNASCRNEPASPVAHAQESRHDIKKAQNDDGEIKDVPAAVWSTLKELLVALGQEAQKDLDREEPEETQVHPHPWVVALPGLTIQGPLLLWVVALEGHGKDVQHYQCREEPREQLRRDKGIQPPLLAIIILIARFRI
mmetsp:Transcript_49563/g.114870  ORF Transcript_49563/g.114870 Transcript_49563/m.114870 type:complete len:284 (+) Transcript_49563:783-1634(+)